MTSWFTALWNSADRLGVWITFANIGIALTLLLTFALTALSIVAGVRKDALQKLADAEREERIAQARESAAAAISRAETAVLGQKEIDLKAERLRAKNLELEHNIEDLKSIATLSDEALAGSRTAYDKLLSLAASDTALSSRAKERVKYIDRQLAFYEQPPGIVLALDLSVTIGDKQVRISELPTWKLFEFLQDENISESTRFSIVNDISKKPVAEVDVEALKVLRNGKYLPAIAATCTVLRRVHTGKFDFMDVKSWLSYLTPQK